MAPAHLYLTSQDSALTFKHSTHPRLVLHSDRSSPITYGTHRLQRPCPVSVPSLSGLHQEPASAGHGALDPVTMDGSSEVHSIDLEISHISILPPSFEDLPGPDESRPAPWSVEQPSSSDSESASSGVVSSATSRATSKLVPCAIHSHSRRIHSAPPIEVPRRRFLRRQSIVIEDKLEVSTIAVASHKFGAVPAPTELALNKMPPITPAPHNTDVDFRALADDDRLDLASRHSAPPEMEEQVAAHPSTPGYTLGASSYPTSSHRRSPLSPCNRRSAPLDGGELALLGPSSDGATQSGQDSQALQIPSPRRKTKLRNRDDYCHWYRSDGEEPLSAPPGNLNDAQLGDVFIHHHTQEDVPQVWIHQEDATWKVAMAGVTPHPVLEGRVLVIRTQAEK
ncbi:hypothetical protein BOTBODRAFT_265025 [Botryobasidium botryosum FD-172 SS1]|uniref:Uncharacterized protein n=1 Tax=Botryobasidium botryosum (strain FD-172 SS1) TaxID=930990 RepID=A0A067LV80_BOTB1|nr:hypothetical protein BOTBODRAFT_265025 [Botryobasidium botryosum FD-172 SS1]